MPSTPPAEVRRLLAERTAARQARDWPLADALRDEIATLGWEVQDGPAGSTARPILPSQATRPAAEVAPLDEPARFDASLQLTAEDHPADLERCLRGLAAHPPSPSWELVIVDNASGADPAALCAAAGVAPEPTIVPSAVRLGWADARTLGLRRSLGRVSVILDTSLEPTGDFLAPLLAAFDDPTVGIAGGWGVRSRDARQFDEAPAGEVDAVEAYCLAVRREALRHIGGFDRRFRFYRNADLDFSFAVRDAGWRAVRTEPLPLRRHEHRGYEALPDAERDRLSRRNFYRFLQRWGDRRDLLLDADPSPTGRGEPWDR